MSNKAETSLATTEETALQELDSNDALGTGIENFEIRPNIIELMQSNHVNKYENVVVGAFRDKLKGEQFVEKDNRGIFVPRTLKIVPLKRETIRLCYTSPEFGSPLLCKSMDGKMPIMGKLAEKLNLEPQCVQGCEFCAKASWKDWKTLGIAPTCKERFRLTFLDRETELPFVITFTAKSRAPFINFIDSIVRDTKADINRNRKTAGYVPYHLYDYCTEMSSQKEASSKGTYYVVRFSNTAKVAEKGQYQGYYEEYVLRPELRRKEALSRFQNEALDYSPAELLPIIEGEPEEV
jgi:hypothetical protein